ncbi:single strand binding [Schistosoma japonicum]|nr:single strand binding [Schistosoma japonicum]
MLSQFAFLHLKVTETPGRMPYRQINTPSDDINQIVLLGRVNYLHLNENSNNVYVSIGLTTKNSVYVFGQPLVDKVKHLTKGDRLCVTGLLSSYLADDGQWKFCITANTVSPYVAESIDNVVNDEESTEQDEVDGEEMFGNYIHDKVDTDNKDSSVEPTVNKT